MRYVLLALVVAAAVLVLVHARGRDELASSHATPVVGSKPEAVMPARVVPTPSAFDPLPAVEPDDAAMPVAPVLDADTFTLAREAVMPTVRACADDAGDARVAVTVRVEVGQGHIRIADARSDSPVVAACVVQAAQALEIAAPPDQPDGAQEVTLFAGG